jgi:hypothetical protein
MPDPSELEEGVDQEPFDDVASIAPIRDDRGRIKLGPYCWRYTADDGREAIEVELVYPISVAGEDGLEERTHLIFRDVNLKRMKRLESLAASDRGPWLVALSTGIAPSAAEQLLVRDMQRAAPAIRFFFNDVL